MKNFYLFFVLSVISFGSFAQTPFGVAEKWGFNAPQFPYFRNKSVLDLKVFKAKLYASMGPDSGYVYRSSTGDPGSFQRVFSEFGVNKVQDFVVSTDGLGYMYANTGSFFSVNMIKRTVDGTNWDNFFQSPGGAPLFNVNVFKPLGGTVDSVYIAYNGANGTTIVRNALDANDYDNVMSSWDTLTEMFTQFGTFASPTCSVVFKDSLYYAFSDNSLFQTGNGRNLHVNTNFINSMGGGQD